MGSLRSQPDLKPRELRRRVLLPARLRTTAGWSDACILNVSSRGLLIHAQAVTHQGATIEVRHGDHAIVARVMWREGPKAGLFAEDGVPVEDILTLSQSPTLQLTAGGGGHVERRRKPRTHEDNRLRARAMEFAAIGFIAASLSGGLFVLVEEALARPLAYVEAALSTSSR